ncbi:MAG: glycerophosphodiester phosphodiesterase [Friedmanniella sp.]|nr:glycerophosphodiester phosphodiesterase [Friedmanniella sp.]
MRPPIQSLRRSITPLLVAALTGAALVAGPVAPAAAAPTPAESSTSTGARSTTARQVDEIVTTPRLVARAALSADYLAPGPQSGRLATPANGRRGPFAGQVIPGFSAAVDNGDGTFWAQPDNGFGAKGNSADFLLRLYLVRPHWARAGGGSGQVQILRYITLSDPDHLIGFDIVHQKTPRRLLTGDDFDIESLQRGADGTLWIGEEFGPYLLHVDPRGRLLQAPVPFPLGGSPQNPELNGAAPVTRQSGGFEALAASASRRYLYPIVEKSLVGESDPRRRVISEFDTRTGRYTARTWSYHVDTDANLVADAQIVRGDLLILERDDFDGDRAVTKRIYRTRLGRTDRDGTLTKTLVVDLLQLDNPAHLGAGGGWGTGDPYSFGYQSVETMVPLADGRLMIANDNNYPGNSARRPGTPDDTEMVIIDPAARTRVPAHEETIIGHRGASGYRPEHTLASYELAIRQCADVIEPDVVSTKDGQLVARHENDISGTTDVADHPEFAGRKTTRSVDGTAITGWFTEDFTLAELRTLRARERLPQVRPANTAYDGLYPIPTLAEVLDLARHSVTCTGHQVGVAPETKHPTYFAGIGLALEQPLVEALERAGLNRRKAPVYVQSFEVGNLQQLHRLTRVRLVQNIDCSGAPYDLKAAGDPRTYADLASPAGLVQVARYADVASFCKDVMIPRDPDGTLAEPSGAIAGAHRAGLEVVGWTFRRENRFLPAEYRRGEDPNAVGDLTGEIRTFLAAGMDGLFTDNPDLGFAAVNGGAS